MFEASTLDEIADAWVKAAREVREGDRVKKAAEPHLKAWFEAHPGALTYKGLIGISRTSKIILDNAKLKAALTGRIFEFEKTVSYHSLSLLVP